MSSPEPRRPTAPDAGPWGDDRDRQALRAAVARAEGHGRGGLIGLLVIVALAGILGSAFWAATTRALGRLGLSSTSIIAPNPAVPTTKLAPPAAPTLTPPAAGEFAR